jgi:hypothetical protein
MAYCLSCSEQQGPTNCIIDGLDSTVEVAQIIPEQHGLEQIWMAGLDFENVPEIAPETLDFQAEISFPQLLHNQLEMQVASASSAPGLGFA